MRAILGRRYHLSASHRLHASTLDAEQNLAAYGKCNNPHGHGHNYVVEVRYSGEVDAMTGMVTNLADLDAFAKRELLDRFDHQNLNLLPEFADCVPTTEHFARILHAIFTRYPDAHLEGIHVEETANNSIDYVEPAPGSSPGVQEQML